MNQVPPQPAPASSAPPALQGEVKNYLNVTSTLSLVWVLLSGVLALVFLVFFVIDLFRYVFASDLFGFLYWGIAALVSLFIHAETRGWIGLADSGQYGVLRERILLWAILGLIFGVLLGLVLIVIYLRLESVGGSFAWNPQPPLPAPQPPPPAYAAPTASPSPPQPSPTPTPPAASQPPLPRGQS